MNNEVELNVMEIDGNQYFLVDTLGDGENNYYYFSNIKDNSDVLVLKDQKEDDEEYFVSLDSDKETDHALSLFYEKYKNLNNNN